MRSEDSGAVTALTVRRVGIDTYRENVAYLHRRCRTAEWISFRSMSPSSKVSRRFVIRVSFKCA